MQYKFLVLLVFFIFRSSFSGNVNLTFDQKQDLWKDMQVQYTSCMSTYQDKAEWCHPQWIAARNDIAKIIQSNKLVDFLRNPCISNTMVRIGYDFPQIFEETYLEFCLRPNTKILINKVEDTDFGSLPLSSIKFKCSTNTLGHLFYLSKIIEYFNKDRNKSLRINTIVELGGGYGNLARLFSQVLPDATIVIFDLPEMNALQWFFLKCTVKNEKSIIFHSNKKEEKNIIVPGAINLIPINLLDQVSLQADVFVSTFALSESTENLQDYISKRLFFDASLCYITGQLNGWGQNFNFENHQKLINNIYSIYSNVECQPFHIIWGELKSYEVIAQN